MQKRKREDDRKKGLPVPDEHVFQNIQERLKYNRYLANMPNGYSVANGMPEAMQWIQKGEISVEQIKEIFICSDGIFHPNWSFEQTVQYIRANGIQTYISIIEELEKQDRVRPDDKTIVSIDLSGM